MICSNSGILLKIKTTFIVSIILFLLSGCGTNLFKAMEKADPEQEAVNYLEDNEPDQAISVLEQALTDEPENYRLISLLSAAYAQKSGVDLIDLALATANNNGSSSNNNTNAITALWPILPEATAENVAGVAYAVTLLNNIPGTSRTDADNFKLAILSTASVSLRMKSFDLDGDGQLSASELAAMTLSDADTIISNLASGASAIAAASGLGDTSSEVAAKIESISDSIQNQSGSDNLEKIKNYFSAS